VDKESTISEYWGYISLFLSTHTYAEREKWRSILLEDVSQSTVQIPSQVSFEIFLLLVCLPFLSLFLHLTPHLMRPVVPHSSSFAVCKLRLKSDDYDRGF